MDNNEAVWSLNEIADLLEIKGENQFKVRAYRKAAAAIANLSESIENLSQEDRLQEIPGVGKNIAQKLEEMVSTGRFSLLERLREEVSPGLRNITQLPGVGLRAARVIYKHLGISDLGELEKAARARKIRSLPGLGPKTELNIIRGIEIIGAEKDRSPLHLALASAEILVGFLESLETTKKVALSGSIRRGKDMVRDVDIIAWVEDKPLVLETYAKHPHLKEILSISQDRVEAITWLGVETDLNLVDEEEFFPFLHWSTGSKEHMENVTEYAAGRGIRLTGTQVLTEEGPLQVPREEDIFAALELPFIPPEIREGAEVIEAACEGRLPALIEVSDIQGDLHIHSSWSDGVSTIEDMVREAIAMGYSYLAITDHSKALAIANGLTWERLQDQWKEIERLRYEYAPFTILKGLEVDILKGGILDYGQDVLEQLDIVIASVHSGFKQDAETMTARLLAVLNNPLVDILAHPTGRILGRRPPYEADFEQIFQVAAETGTFLEINASPDRLDLSAEHARMAKEHGIMLAINTDAHDKSRLQEIAFGVTNARRGWLEASDVLNTRHIEDLQEILRERRNRALSRRKPI